MVKSKTKNLGPAVSAARAAAFDILLRVERNGAYASELLHSRVYDRLDPSDHGLTTELVMGVLRWRSLLDSEIAKYSAQPLSRLDLEILSALRLAIYQLRWLTRIPARAALNESVELVKRARKRSAAPFVNAVLRKFAGEVAGREDSQHEISSASTETLAVSSAHPPWLVERWVQAYGMGSAFRICRQDQTIPVTAIRLRGPEAEEQLRREGVELAPGVLLASARRVLRGDVASTAAFRAGMCAIQDEASQLIAALVGDGTHILDCCAAPGGKTAAIAERNPRAEIVAVELHPHRAELLRTLLNVRDRSAQSLGQIQIVAADARDLPLAMKFDRVLADVPCSGTGTLSRNPEIKWRLVPTDLADLQLRQIAILRSAMERVAAGGRVIYSTCSLESEENEEVVERALAAEGREEAAGFRILDCGNELEMLRERGELVFADISSLTSGPYWRTLPGVHPCDGFFAAILQKS
jgi:16S rRNA (cytosine967-C5)-methyltransferase